ncbi:hypothetical protein MLD38_033926 [Melastoma candidum]|uniref:Uncharacterized protein n=1 Tax=Melastoma candidum TaxID=119954 RepID=A0ACB9MC54_9MYRT|nr:hypothetical protein MLD38_033926 [Melastoma candidum]
MKCPKLDYITLFLICFNILSSGRADLEQVTFYLHNKCPFPLWPATAPNTGHPVVADGGFYLPSNTTRRVSTPADWNGRIWARTGCVFGSNGKQACETGDCEGRLACNGLIGMPPVTLVEVSLQADKGKASFYDVSLVDGYNLPVTVTTKPSSQKCTVTGCSEDLNSLCPDELQVHNKKGEVVACKSACLSFNADNFCCRNDFGTPDKCRPSVYSKIFKDACPGYYSYAYDSPPPLRSCASKEFMITFCPANWGGEQNLIDEA